MKRKQILTSFFKITIIISIFTLCTQVSYGKSIPITFTKLTGHTAEITGVYRANLSGLPLTSLQSITIMDNSSGLGGSDGQFTGFDLDAIMLSNTSAVHASGVQSLLVLPLFDFTPKGTIFDPGRQRPPTDSKLFGTDITGNIVDNTIARLDSFDGKARNFFFISDPDGFISMGDNGVLSFNLTSPVSLDSLFLYIGEVGDNGEVAAGEILISDEPIFQDTDKSRNKPVYSINISRLFHHLDCKKLISTTEDLIKFSSKEDAIRAGGKPCPECIP